MADLSVTVDGLKLPNPFVIGSGPPGTNANVIGKAFDEGWGAVIAKTISLDASKVINVAPRYARMRVGPKGGETIVFQRVTLTPAGFAAKADTSVLLEREEEERPKKRTRSPRKKK